MQIHSFLEGTRVEYFCSQTGLSTDLYLKAFDQLQQVFPFKEAQEYADQIATSEGGLGAPFDIRPSSFCYLARHPLKLLMSGRVTEYRHLSDVLRVGLDLLDTRNIPGIVGLKNGLRNIDEYVSRLFELEVLATLQRAGMSPVIHGTPDFLASSQSRTFQIEAKHRGVPFARAVAQDLMTRLAFHEFGELSINLTKLGAAGETVTETAEKIESEVLAILDVQKSVGAVDATISTDLVAHYPSSGAKTLSFFDGANNYDEQVRRIVHGALQEKDSQIGRSTCKHATGIVALDCRSLFPALPPSDKRKIVSPGWLEYYEPRIKEWTASLVSESQLFLFEARNTRGVLIWLRNPSRGFWSGIAENFRAGDLIRLISRDSVVEIPTNPSLADVLENLRID